MAWDSTKSPGDLISSADYNDKTTAIKQRGIPQTDSKRGSDCTGGDGDTARRLVLDTAGAKTSGLSVFVNGVLLHINQDFTLASNTLTFTNKLWDDAYIQVNYFT